MPSHILFFLVDDYGFADASYKNAMYPGAASPPTPAIDALALGGVRLESYYVHQLCSPTRTALLSSRYAYSIGAEDSVIVDGVSGDMPLNVQTMADRLSKGGWKTSAYGKWDAGMTVWGSTPTCRGFDHFAGFYSAATDYFTHDVGGPILDFRFDVKPDKGELGNYSTEVFTQRAQAWITEQVQSHDAETPLKTFAYVAHEAVHGPMDGPQRLYDGACAELVGPGHPIRQTYCAMVRSLDESVANLTATYKALGIWKDTLVILSTDNGGIPADGGNNFPLRGNKATVFEGGVRGISFVSGAGLSASVRGTISYGMMHVVDWGVTIVEGIAGLPLTPLGRPCPSCKTPPMPYDGVNQWPMLANGAKSERSEMLIEAHGVKGSGTELCYDPPTCTFIGEIALRSGKWKIIHGSTGVWNTIKKPDGTVSGGPKSGYICASRSGAVGWTAHRPDPKTGFPVKENYGANESNPWCPNGWVPPPNAKNWVAPIPPPEVASNCTDTKAGCVFTGPSMFRDGGIWLFDVENDMTEKHNVAAENPDVVKSLMARIAFYLARNVSDVTGKGFKDPAAKAYAISQGSVWTPWRGDENPAHCDTNKTDPNPAPAPRPPAGPFHSSVSKLPADLSGGKKKLTVAGWAWNASFPGGGVPPCEMRILVDGASVFTMVANIVRSGLVNITGAPNTEHGFLHVFAPTDPTTKVLAGKGKHTLNVQVSQTPAPGDSKWTEATPPVVYVDGKLKSDHY